MKTILRDGLLVAEIEHDAGPRAGAVDFTSDLSAARFLARFAAEPSNLSALRGLLQAALHLETAWLGDGEVLDQVARHLAGGRLRLTTRSTDALASWGDEEPAEEPAASFRPVARKEKTWIEIELLDMEDNPIPGEPYRIELPDGSVREGRLDSRGRAYFADIDPGVCEVRWPRLDDSATERPGARAGRG